MAVTHFDSDKINTDPEKALIVLPVLKHGKRSASDTVYRDIDAVQEEAEGLARAISLDVEYSHIVNVSDIKAGRFFGAGQIEEISFLIEDYAPDIVIVNCSLSPVQQRNLEKAWDIKVIDRTGLILEIFGARAQTKEGRLQVELAALDYQKSRLVRSWTHLERQRGGAGFMGGPGERQIEIDRRLINDRITKLKKELSVVKRTRDLGRKSRERVPFPTVALVGYTNAGKSTLFNALTDADVFAEDLPFATLDPTLRRISLPSGKDVILSDTVGFISELPTHLVAAFRATLEETIHADVLFHVIDCSRADYQAQRDDVIGILADLGIDYDTDPRVIEVYNKIDTLDEEKLSDFKRKKRFEDNIILISAKNKFGFDDIYQNIEDIVEKDHVSCTFFIPYKDGKALSWLHKNSEIITRTDEEKGVRVLISIDAADYARFMNNYGYTPLEGW